MELLRYRQQAVKNLNTDGYDGALSPTAPPQSDPQP